MSTTKPSRRDPRGPATDCADQLEPMIVERTAELARVNEELETANTALQVVNRELAKIATIDALTQIANRRHFDDRLEREWSRGLRARQSVALLICDVDFFKGYNDHYGHLAGDECLRQLAQALVAAAARPSDLVARFGGEEFAILVPDTDVAGALTLAQRVQQELASRRIPHASSRVSCFLTVSIGVASRTPGNGATGTQLIAAADEALYMAKGSGRNTYRLWRGNGTALQVPGACP